MCHDDAGPQKITKSKTNATKTLEVRAPHLSFMLLKEYWFRELYLGLKVTASFNRSESYTRVIDGQVRCITPEVKPQNLQVIWNVQFITVFVPAWMIPPVYHSLRRESIKTASSASPHRQSSRFTTEKPRPSRAGAPATDGLKLVIKKKVLPTVTNKRVPSLEQLAARSLRLTREVQTCYRFRAHSLMSLILVHN